jgi:WD40 repeat protein
MPIESRSLKELFLAALAVAPAERAAWLERECGQEAELRRQIELMLAAHDAPQSLLDRLAPAAGTPEGATAVFAGADADCRPRPEADEAGDLVVGRYKLLEQIGEGGMGTVWMAQQQEPVKRLVALKVIKAGMDSRRVLARFEAERQALALMSHPNIARILDAGTTERGQPFFVMELVKGVPLTRYCDERQLSVADRLQIFQQVCQAVQHAHQKGIIHRDLKPGNILVESHDGRPVPKVIDFGLAKAMNDLPLTDRSLFTNFGAVLGTPLYMAPEQAEFSAIDVDTRADIYALGVLLYELLTGSTPLEKGRLAEAAWDEICRVIKEEEPPRPSTRLSSSEALPSIAARRQSDPRQLGKLVRGDLDWIVMKALAKERERRYETASALAADLERFLHDEPVAAGPPTVRYRLRKFARRQRGPLAAVAGIFLVLVAGVVGTAWQAVQANRAREAEATRAESEGQAKDAALDAGNKLRDARDELWSNLYVSRAALIQSAWDAREYGLVRELLTAQVPIGGQRDLRGIEWHYLDRQLNGDLRTVQLPRTKSQPAPISPDGTRLLRYVEDTDGLWLKSFDTSSGRAVFALKMPTDTAFNPAFSTDGKWIVAAVLLKPVVGVATEMDLRRWDAVTGAEDPRFRGAKSEGLPVSGPDGLPVLCRSPNVHGFRIYPPGGDEIPSEFGLWDGQTVRNISTPPLPGIPDVLALSPDGKVLVVSVFHGQMKLLDVRTGKLLLNLAAKVPWRPLEGAVAFSADGKRLAVAGETLTVWDVATGRQVLEVTEQVWSPVFSPDGTRIAYMTGSWAAELPAPPRQRKSSSRIGYLNGAWTTGVDAKIVDAASGEVRRVLRGHDGGITNLAFTRDGTVLVTAGGDRIKHWDATLEDRVPVLKDRPVRPFAHSTPSQDASRLVACGPYAFQVWGRGENAVFSPPRSRLNPSDESKRIDQDWPQPGPAPLKLVLPAPKPGRMAPPGPGHNFPRVIGLGQSQISPDDRRVAWWNHIKWDDAGQERWESELQLWDPDAGRQLVGGVRTARITFAEFSADSRRLAAVVDPPGEIKVWDAENGRELFNLPLPKGQDFRPAFSPDGGRLGVIGTGDGSLVVGMWDVESGRPLPSARIPLGGWKPQTTYLTPAFDFGARRVAIPLLTDFGPGLTTGIVRVWDVETGSHTVDLKGVHALGEISHLAFSPDGHRLAMASEGKMKLWDPDSGAELLSIAVDGTSIEHLAFSPDGHAIDLVVKTSTGFEKRRLDGRPRDGGNPPSPR